MEVDEVQLTEDGKIKLDLDPSVLLQRKPKKSILKMKQESSQDGRDGHARFDEMNILATYHPPDKDYGTMKIDEPKTPYHNYSDSEGDDASASGSANMRPRRVSLGSAVDPEAVAAGLASAAPRSPGVETMESDDDDEEHMTEEQKAKRREFEKRRKAHYNEGAALKAHLANLEDETDE